MDVGSWSFLMWYVMVVAGLAVTWLPAGALNARVGIMFGYVDRDYEALSCMKAGWAGVIWMLVGGVTVLGMTLTIGLWRLLCKIAGVK